jgi:hypothetical protein
MALSSVSRLFYSFYDLPIAVKLTKADVKLGLHVGYLMPSIEAISVCFLPFSRSKWAEDNFFQI